MHPWEPLATPPTAEICGKFPVAAKVQASEGGREVTMMFLLERETMQETYSPLSMIPLHQLISHPKTNTIIRQCQTPSAKLCAQELTLKMVYVGGSAAEDLGEDHMIKMATSVQTDRGIIDG